MTSRFFAICVVAALPIFACGTGAADDEIASSEHAATSDIEVMFKAEDGSFHVRCANGRTEILSAAELDANVACVSYAPVVKAACENSAACVPYFMTAETCEASGAAAAKAAAVRGVGKPTQAQVNACAEALRRQSCNGFRYIPECDFAGTLPKDAACQSGQQCAGGSCQKRSPEDACGTCADSTSEGAECDVALGKMCAGGLFCHANKCTRPIAKGDRCDLTNGFLCLDSVCVAGTCSDPVPAGGACPSGVECGAAAACNFTTRKCETTGVMKAGDPCLAGYLCSSGSRCDFATVKCVAYRKEGEPCTETGFECDPAGLECKASKCTARPAATAECK